MRSLPFIATLSLLSASSFASDTRELSLERRKLYDGSATYCVTGRVPMQSSADAWAVRPYPGCSFSGIFDTKINPLRLEPPVLNPRLSLAQLKIALLSLGASVEDGAGSLRFSMPSGPSFEAAVVGYKKLVDPLLSFAAYPAAWGQDFLSISAGSAGDLGALIAWAKRSPDLFWHNPHYADEVKVLERLSGPRPYLPLPLLSSCGSGAEWRSFTGSLLAVGDMHTGDSVRLFSSVIAARKFAWVALENTRDNDPALRSFLEATSAEAEEPFLAALVSRQPKDTLEPLKGIFRALKAQNTKIVLIDYSEPYFNFPFTNVSSHGLIIAARNRMWVNRLPETWQGAGAIFAGVDHFLVTPHADFQDFFVERFPGATIGLMNPMEKCAP